jgi:Na+-transporting NADH:ubiquinone oxidoreductase subunit A
LGAPSHKLPTIAHLHSYHHIFFFRIFALSKSSAMNYRITKGLDLKIAGAADDNPLPLMPPAHVYVRPSDFRWLTPKLLVQQGDAVQVGTPMFCDKKDERIVVVSPVEGRVEEVVRGEKRVIEAITITCEKDAAMEKTVDFEEPSDAESIRKLLLEYGLWPCLRQRPFSVIPSPDAHPKALFIPCFDSHPLAPDFNILLRGKEEPFLHGLKMLQRAAGDVPAYLCMREGADNQLFEKAENVKKYYFSGPHPAGNVGTHIYLIDPLDKDESVWYADPQDIARIGEFFLHHRLHFQKTAALTGSAVKCTGYFTAIYGADLSSLFGDNLIQENVRIISGNVLRGNALKQYLTLGFYDRQITVIPEGGKREILGWLLPGFRKWSRSHTYTAWLTPKRTYSVDTSLHGGRRAFMLTDVYDEVFPFDLLPLQLLKACQIKDIEQMESLGIYEVDDEDFALCELVCPSKMPCQQIVEDALMTLKHLS